MHIETLKIFCDLAQFGSFSKAAEKHFVTQSAVSQQLAQLELMYKCQLVDRKKRPIELTRAGKLLYEACHDIVGRYEELKSELNALNSPAGAKISIAAIFSVGMHALPNYVKKFMLQFPNVNVRIEYHSAEKIYEQALAGDIDFGLVAVPKRDKRLEVYDFEEEPLVLACSPKHPFANEGRIDIHKIQFERFISFEKSVPTRQWIDGIMGRYNIVVNSVMEFDNTETIKRAVEINSGISILPLITIGPEVESGTIKAIRFSDENFVRPTAIIVRRNKVFSRAGRYFIEMLRKKAEN